MTDAAKKLMGEVLALPPEDRRWLCDQLVEVVRGESEVEEELRRTVLRRIHEAEEGEVESHDAMDVFHELIAKYPR